jgi:hypothetical protein
VGAHTGTPVEDIGVRPEHQHPITRNDLINDNADLFTAATKLLRGLPVRELRAQVGGTAGNSVTVNLSTKNLDRIDPFVNGRPQQSVDLSSSTTKLTIAKPDAAPAVLRLEGYASGKLSANRVLVI